MAAPEPLAAGPPTAGAAGVENVRRTDAPFAHIGGAVIADHGPIALGEARALTAFYAAEALAAGEGPWRKDHQRRAQALA